MIRFRCFETYVNTKLLAQLDLLSNALASQNGGGWGGRRPPPFEKHGQRSEHTSFLQRLIVSFVASCLHYEIAGGLGGRSPPNMQNMDEDQNTYIFVHPSDGFVY